MSLEELTDYEVRNTVAHLIAAGRVRTAADLLWQSTDDGRNLWYLLKSCRCGSAAYADDLSTMAAALRIDAPGDLSALGRIVLLTRIALIRASLNSRSANYPPRVMEQAVARGVLTRREALERAEGIPDAGERVAAQMRLFAGDGAEGDQTLLHQIMEALPNVRQWEGPRLMESLVDAVPDNLLDDIGAIVAAIEDARLRRHAMICLAQRHTGSARRAVLQQAIADCREIGVEHSGFADCVRSMAPLLEEPEGLALAGLATLAEPADRYAALAVLVPLLPGEMLREILERAKQNVPDLDAIKRKSQQTMAMLSDEEVPRQETAEQIVPYFSHQTLDAHEKARAELIAAIGERWCEGYDAADWVDAVWTILPPRLRCELLVTRAEDFDDRLVWGVLNTCQDLARDWPVIADRVDMLTKIAGCSLVPPDAAQRLLRFSELQTYQIDTHLGRAEALSRIARLAHDLGLQATATELSSCALHMATDRPGTNLGFEDLVDAQESENPKDQLALTFRLLHVTERQRQIVERLAPAVTSQTSSLALEATLSIRSIKESTRAAVSLERVLPPGDFRRLVESGVATLGSASLEEFLEWLDCFGDGLDEPTMDRIVDLALSRDSHVVGDPERILDWLAPVLTSPQIGRLLTVLDRIDDTLSMTAALIALAEAGDLGQEPEIAAAISAAVDRLNDEDSRSWALTRMVRANIGDLEADIDHLLQTNGRWLWWEVSEVVPKLTAAQSELMFRAGLRHLGGFTPRDVESFVAAFAARGCARELVAALTGLPDSLARSMGLAEAIRVMDGSARDLAIRAALAQLKPEYRAHALALLLDTLPALAFEAFCAETLAAAEAISEETFAETMRELVSVLPESLLPTAHRKAASLNDLRHRVEASTMIAARPPWDHDRANWRAILGNVARLGTSVRDDWLRQVCGAVPEQILLGWVDGSDRLDEEARLVALEVAAERLSKEIGPRAFEHLRAFRPVRGAMFLGAVADGLSEDRRRDSVQFVRDHVPADMQPEILVQLVVVSTSPDRWDRLIELIATLPNEDYTGRQLQDRIVGLLAKEADSATRLRGFDAFLRARLGTGRQSLFGTLESSAKLLPQESVSAIADAVETVVRWWP